MVGTGCVLNAFATSTEYLIFTYALVSGNIIFIFVCTVIIVSDPSQSRKILRVSADGLIPRRAMVDRLGYKGTFLNNGGTWQLLQLI